MVQKGTLAKEGQKVIKATRANAVHRVHKALQDHRVCPVQPESVACKALMAYKVLWGYPVQKGMQGPRGTKAIWVSRDHAAYPGRKGK